jgi:hypothetical protein
MGRRPATIRDANAAKACADSVVPRRMAGRSIPVFAVLLLLVCAPILRAQATLGTTTGDASALAINSNNSPGLAYNAVLNSDSSVSLLQDGVILSGQGCPAFSSLSSGISSGAVYVDFANSNIYLTMIAGGAVFAAYESIDQQGNCTQGPLLTLTTNSLSNLEMNVDPVQGSVYILNSFGAFPDTLYILPIAPWSASPLPTPAQFDLDYSAQYGPIVIDPSNHLVYVNDLGDSAYGAAGTYSTSGFFVYDPNPTPTLQHVTSYMSSSGTTPFNVGTLLTNGAGKLVLINENPHASTANLSVPITVIDTTQAGFSFSNPAAALSTISAFSPYTAIGGADIDPANNVVYIYGFNSNSPTTPGMLLEYKLAPGAATPETVLSGSAAMPSLYSSLAPWNQLNFNPESTELVLSVGSQYGSGALGLTSQLCAGAPVSLTQLFGSSLAPTPLGYAVVNSVSGYTFAIQPGPGNPPGPSIVNFVAPLSGGCSTSPPIVISPTTLPYGFAGESYFEDFTATGGSGAGYTWSVTSGTALSAVGLSLTSAGVISGYPNASETAAPLTVKVVDSQGNSATQNYTLTIYPTFSITPTTLPAGSVGTPYSQTFTASGGAGGPFTFSVASGTALSAVGLTLSSTGTISGTPNATETAAAFVLRVADSLGDFSQLNYTLTVNSAVGQPAQVTDNETITVSDAETFPDVVDSEPITVTDMVTVTVSAPLTITGPNALPAGLVGTQYQATTVTANGGTQPYTWSATGTPPGLTIGPTTGIISGIPTTAGAFAVTVTVTDPAGLTSSANFSIAVTASAPIVNLIPASLTFSAQASGMAPAAQTVTLSNTGNAPLSITGTGISISGGNTTAFSQTNSCGTSAAAGGNCVISVTFNSSLLAAGTYMATLNVVDNASGSPQQVPLSGIVLSSPSVSCNIPTINLSGDSGTAQVTCIATGSTGPVALECNLQASLATYVTCSFNPSSLNFSSTITLPYTASTTLTIQAVQKSASLGRKSWPWAVSSGGVAFGAVLWLPAWAFVMRRKKGSPRRGISTRGNLFLLILFCGLSMFTSCGGKSGPATPPAGTYQASVVLTGPGLNETITFTIQEP